MKKTSILFAATLTVALLLSACGGSAGSATPTPVALTNPVTAEAHLVPVQGQHLSFLASGQVSEVLVKRGDVVTSGQVLARLSGSQPAQAALAAALLGQTNAQQAFDALTRTADLAHAQAWQSWLTAQKNTAAAQLAWDRLDQTALQKDIDDAQGTVTDRQTDLANAQKDFDKYSSLPTDNPSRQTSADALRTAQVDYDLAVQKLIDATNRRDLVSAALKTALAAEAEAKHAYDLTASGADLDKLALAQANLDSAKAQAAAAQYALDNYELKAPFAGTVEDLTISAGSLVSPSSWAVALADTSLWYADTSDLGELDAVKVSLGQAVSLTVDALPGVTMDGAVQEISGSPTLSGGDILYTVRVVVKNPDPRLRWGMTIEVTFPEGK